MLCPQIVEISPPPPPAFPAVVRQAKSTISKRSGPRSPVNRLAMIRCIYPARESRFPGTILEVSKNRLKFRSRAQFEPGSILHIFVPHLILIGVVVRYSRSTPAGFMYGFEIESTLGGFD